MRMGGLTEPCIRWVSRLPDAKVAIFRGKDMPGHARRHSAVSCAKMAEPMEMMCGLWTRMGPKKHVLHVCAHCCNLANTTEPSLCSSDAAFFIKLI